MQPEATERLRRHLEVLYPGRGEEVLADVLTLVQSWARSGASAEQEGRHTADRDTESWGRQGLAGAGYSEQDVFVIAYGDHVRETGIAPLRTLASVLSRHAPEVSAVHLLPHHPATGDGGFAVADYEQVEPALGTWADVSALAQQFRLMLDAVVNHTSTAHLWFRNFCATDPADPTSPAGRFYRTADPADERLAQVTRPRTTDLLTAVEAVEGKRWVWTTFSAEQADLDFREPAVLLAITAVLLDYLRRGASWIRLDAIAFLWKELGTTCIHLPQTHEVVRFWRTLVDALAPGSVLLTETNVPHAENVSYLGTGDEAHAVYQFALPPLTLAAFHQRDASALTSWLANLDPIPAGTTFFTFLASHDGIGLRPVEQLLSREEVAALGETVAEHGGLVSWRTLPDGSRAPYELNSTYFDALRPPGEPEDEHRAVARFLAAHAILLSVPGVPALYLHSLLGSRNWTAGAQESGHARDINRERLERSALEAELSDPASRRTRVLAGLREMMRVRTAVSETAASPFHPDAAMDVLDAGSSVVALCRRAAARTVLCLQEVSGQAQRVRIAGLPDGLRHARDLLGPELGSGAGEVVRALPEIGADGLDVELGGYGVRWLELS
ncbi:sugar phosphorylase [Bogoriella caseilytica]|uniref:Sucrose phosphorylase n=1 Tax=Bogoriella caseilytica TaxID=56055 RepID=A0A3N2BGG6_9MICO|nr:sugar phosphorylase [Bogoriella caseilytica]ROR74308.1 sucrose phosphorylase [Bogoriella caseilytica]